MEKNILKFVIGNETRPVVENLFNIKENSFFHEVYRKAIEIISEIVEQNGQRTNDDYDKYKERILHDARNNIVAFVGDRGVGKTSCMKTIYNVLRYSDKKLQNEQLEVMLRETIGREKFVTLPIIDPTYFEEGHNILDIIISLMFDRFYEYARQRKPDFTEEVDDDLQKTQALINRFERVKKCLDLIKHDTPNTNNDTFESLSEFAYGINLKVAIGELVEKYLSYFRSSFLAIAIDDLDMQTRYAYNMVEEIRKYLIQHKIIILIGIKISQLSDLIKQHYYQENKDIISNHTFTDTTENLAGKYLSKLIPFNQRVYIPNIVDQYDNEIQILSQQNNLPMIRGSIYKVPLNLIYIKTHYMFYHAESNPSMIVPRNLRDLLNLISLLQRMPDNDIDSNRIRFKDYFINTWCADNLSSEMFLFVKNISLLEVTNINKQVIYYLTQLGTIKTSQNEGNKIYIDKHILDVNNRGYNVSFADVYYIIDKISTSCDVPLMDNLIFAIKTIYTFMLSDLYLKIDEVDERRESLLSQYNINTKNLNKHFRKATKLMILSDYEKLLGGNVLRISRLTNVIEDLKERTKKYDKGQDAPQGEVKEQYKNAKPDFLFMRSLNNIGWRKLYEYIRGIIINSKKTPLISDVKDTLNMWEFFILGMYVNTDKEWFRTQKQCYYLSVPYNFPMDPENPIVFSATSILFNIVKYYEYYKIYKSICKLYKSEEPIRNSNFCAFWDLICKRPFVDHSIIAKLLDIKPETNDASNTQSMNNSNNTQSLNDSDSTPSTAGTIKNAFIRNVEMLDILEDYLPNLKKRLLQYSDSEHKPSVVDLYIEFYKRLFEFQISVYGDTIESLTTGSALCAYEPFSKLEIIYDFLRKMSKNQQNLFLSLLNFKPFIEDFPIQ